MIFHKARKDLQRKVVQLHIIELINYIIWPHISQYDQISLCFTQYLNIFEVSCFNYTSRTNFGIMTVCKIKWHNCIIIWNGFMLLWLTGLYIIEWYNVYIDKTNFNILSIFVSVLIYSIIFKSKFVIFIEFLK